MPRRTAHDELQALTDAAAAERVKLREAEVAVSEADAALKRIGADIEAAYVAEDEQLATKPRTRLGQAEEEFEDRQRRLDARNRKATEAAEAVENFRREHAADLISERADDGARLASDLQAAAERLVELDRRWAEHAQGVNALVALLEHASPPHDGPPLQHPLTAPVAALRRELQRGATVPDPRPRWDGVTVQAQQNAVHRLLRAKRERKRDDTVLARLAEDVR